MDDWDMTLGSHNSDEHDQSSLESQMREMDEQANEQHRRATEQALRWSLFGWFF